MVSSMAFTLVARALASASRPLSATVRCDSESNTTHPPRIVVVGGGIMGSSAAFGCWSCAQFVYYDFFPQYSQMGNISIILEGFKYKNGRIGGAYVMLHIEDGVPGVKIGMHCNGRIISSEDFVVPKSANLNRLPNQRIDEELFLNGINTDLDTQMENFARRFAKVHLPTIDSSKVSSYGRCIYQACTLQDGRFLIRLHPDNPDIVIACGFTGEGFKFAPVIGEFVVAEVTKSAPQQVFAAMREAFRLDRV